MICPACKSDMIVVERDKIELDYCGKCGGVWFDSGELEILLASLGIGNSNAFLGGVIKGPEAKTPEGARRCPVCSDRMRKSTIGEQPKVLVDACKRGDGLWFDGGELDDLLTQLASGPLEGPDVEKKISAFLGDMFKARHSEKQN